MSWLGRSQRLRRGRSLDSGNGTNLGELAAGFLSGLTAGRLGGAADRGRATGRRNASGRVGRAASASRSPAAAATAAIPGIQASRGEASDVAHRPVRAGLVGDHLKREVHEPDYVIFVAVVALAAVGVLMVYSTSAILSYANSGNTFAMVAPQILWGLLGIGLMLGLMRVDYRWLRVLSVPLFLLALILLVAVFLPVVGAKVNGSARYLQVWRLPQVHPAELAKLALIVYLSHWLATRGGAIRSFWRGTLPFAIIAAPAILLVAREPDLGTAAVIALIALTLFFVAGANLLHLALAVGGGTVAGVLLLLAAGPDRIQRVLVVLDPWKDPQGAGFHTIKGLEAIGVGGLFGIGLGQDRIYVPNDFNDFIFAIIAEQLGLIGGVVVIGLFLALAYAGVRTALRAPDTFGGLVAAGITAWLCFQALINIGVVVAVVPVTGITLPFVSDGGSSLLISFAAVGILLSISRETVERGSWNASADSGRGYGRTYLPGTRRRSVAPRAAGRS